MPTPNPSMTFPQEEAITLLPAWYQLFPACFQTGTTRQPLKVGIHEDLVAYYAQNPAITAKQIQVGIKAYTHTPDYLGALQVDAHRIDLQGNPTGQVTAGEAQWAKRRLAQHYASEKTSIAAPAKNSVMRLTAPMAKQAKEAPALNKLPEVVSTPSPRNWPRLSLKKKKPLVSPGD